MSAADRQNKSPIHKSEQEILNWSFDEVTKTLVVNTLKYDPAGNAIRDVTADLAQIIDEASSTVTYIGEATIATATSSALWRIRRVTVASTVTTVAWADGNSNFDNVWNNRASLSYS